MGRFIAISVVLSVFAVTGCSASTQGKASTTPEGGVSSLSSAAYSPPGEVELTFEDPRDNTPRSNVAAASFRPNLQERPTRGAVHAAAPSR